jgi:transcriptional regulator GlxA family with amidase domain
MGITPSDYLLYVRLDMACRLLLNTDLPIDKIARRSGIGTGGGLAKIFRKHLSTTPTEYRAENKLCRNYS